MTFCQKGAHMYFSRYEYVKINGVQIPKHRYVWEQANGPIPDGYDVHHIDGNGHNNDLSNLQLIKHGEHVAMHTKMRSQGTDPVDVNDDQIIRSRQCNKESRIRHLEARKEHARKYREEHAEEIRATKKLYRDAHKAEAKAYREAHAEELRLYRKKYREEHPEKYAAYYQKRRALHHDELVAYSRKYNEPKRLVNEAKRALDEAYELRKPLEELSKLKLALDQAEAHYAEVLAQRHPTGPRKKKAT